MSCESSGRGRATLKVTRKAARRLDLRSRTVVKPRLECTTGKKLRLRLKPSRSTARRDGRHADGRHAAPMKAAAQ